MPSDSPKVVREREWERHQTRIWHLLLWEKMQLHEIRDRMKRQGFCATLNEYRSRLRSWGFCRNNPEPTRNYITHRVEKRKSLGKRSNVVVAGLRWSEEKIQKETCRNFYPTHEKFRDASPCTPPGPMVSVCSPVPFDPMAHIPFEWPSELPWLRFTKMVSEAPADILGTLGQRLRQVRSETGTNALSIFGPRSMLPLVARHLGLSHPQIISNPIKLSMHLRSIMPEIIPGEHLMRSQGFIKNSSSAAREFLTLALYLVSNKSIDGVLKAGPDQDELLLDLMYHSAIFWSCNSFLTEPTVASIIEEVWRASLRRCNRRLVNWILDLDIHLNLPNELIPWQSYSETYYHKPLIVVTSNWGSALYRKGRTEKDFNHDALATIRILLDHGASPDSFCCYDHGTPLEWAIGEGFLDVVKIFVEHGIRTHGHEYLEQMEFGALVCLPGWLARRGNQQDVLDYMQSLCMKVFPCLKNPIDALLCPEGLIKAAVTGGSVLLDLLQAKGADFDCHNAQGEFPMGAVIASEDLKYQHRGMQFSRCEALIALGASVNYVPPREDAQGSFPSVLHIASFLGSYNTLKFLLMNEANHHAPAQLCIDGVWLYSLGIQASNEIPQGARSPLTWALLKGWHGCAILLLKFGAPLEGHELLLLLETLPETDRGYSAELVTILLARGARLDSQNSSGQSPLDMAMQKAYHPVANALLAAAGALLPVGAMKYTARSSDWLCHFKRVFMTDNERGEEDYDMLLEHWCQQYPCESLVSQNARFIALSAVIEDIRPLKFALKCYPKAYSSSALRTILRCCINDNNTSCLPTLQELLRRRRPELVEYSVELRALSHFVVDVLRLGSTGLSRVLDLLLSQLRSPDRLRSQPWDNPLIEYFTWRFVWHSDEMSLSDPAENVQLSDSILNMFLDYGFKANTALGLLAIQEGCSIDHLERLMAIGFDPRRRYRWSNTALQLAVRRNDLDMVRFLSDKGVNVNGRPRWGSAPHGVTQGQFAWCGLTHELGRTALQSAVEDGNWACVELLVSLGANVNAPPARIRGATALQLAAMKGYTGLVGWLISRGAEVHAKGATVKGMTAIEGLQRSAELMLLGSCSNTQTLEMAKEGINIFEHSYMEHQVGWSKEEEDTIDQDDLLGDIFVDAESFAESHATNEDWDYCRDKNCVGETESVDGEVEEPGCCHMEPDTKSSNSDDLEIADSFQDALENETPCCTEDVSTSRQDEVFEFHRENSPMWMQGHAEMETTVALGHGVTFGGLTESQIIAYVESGVLPEAEFDNERLAPTGPVLSEVIEEGIADELYGPVSIPGRTDDPNTQDGGMAHSEYLSGDWMDFSETQIWETQPGNSFFNMNIDQQE
ncbi:ankyrin repeat-containing domain protein [Apiospora arundinis]